MSKNNKVKIEKGEWYEFAVIERDEKGYRGECIREPFVNVSGSSEVGFLCNNDKEKNVVDLSFLREEIRIIVKIEKPIDF